jgi:diguanylate cyclase (GGDEF)-like protein
MDLTLETGELRAASLALGALVGALAAYVALDLARRVPTVGPRLGLRWLSGAAISLGTGLWSIHVIAVSALALPYRIGYHPLAALGGWLLAALLGGLGLGAVSGRLMTLRRMLVGAAALGVAIATVQLGAMLSLGLRPGIDWEAGPVAATAAAAVVGCAAAVALTFRTRRRSRRHQPAWQALAAVILGLTLVLGQQLAIGSAGLATQTYSAYEGRVAPATLTLLASVGSIAMLLVALVLSILEARLRASLRHAEGELQRQSFRDPLTKLPNRLMFEGTLAQAAQQADEDHGRFALLFIDLDAFKPVNEALGHAGGDRMLRAVASRLKAHAKAADFVAHLGGDEFLMLVRGNPREDEIARLAARLLEALNQPCRSGGREASVTSSIGIAMYPDHGTMSMLIAHAEAAMRAAKSAGGASWCFFEPRMMSGAREQVELLQDLRGALAQGQLELYYQPKVHAPSGEITGAEALLRWHHPERGMVLPSVFIPIAERFGLINSMGNWVIDEACRQARAWRDQGLLMRVAINLSVHQLRNPELVERIAEALRQHQVNPRLLTCEITESVAMEDAEGAMLMFEKLAAAGVHLSIDDFGTGYSSLSYLRKLRAGELKIDRSFVLDLETSSDARAVVDAVIKLAQALGLKVVAEGVETEEQHTILRSLGCDELQGFLFAKPMPAKDLAVWAIEDVGPRALDFRDSLYQGTTPGALH